MLTFYDNACGQVRRMSSRALQQGPIGTIMGTLEFVLRNPMDASRAVRSLKWN